MNPITIRVWGRSHIKIGGLASPRAQADGLVARPAVVFPEDVLVVIVSESGSEYL